MPSLACWRAPIVISKPLGGAILRMWHSFKMGYVPARPVRALGTPITKAAFSRYVAHVIDVETIRDGPDEQLVYSPMGVDKTSVDAHQAVAALGSRTGPWVAGVRAFGSIEIADDPHRVKALSHNPNLILIESRRIA
jgi:hypothetical protein